ncbi:hypothetical protein OG264_08440 [Streptomyces xanthophaeus]|uniref:hypothetical protein n=1 Tax=Streptomyces xanthophaeus TaxID=67385 RepID=UPI003865F8D9|nr:hypothetical protein OG264_08440 [Streptomyces xanthophaeus]WST63491.1 hypothetical protein OG605_29920 [Streptomyces xanthophaeus]
MRCRGLRRGRAPLVAVTAAALLLGGCHHEDAQPASPRAPAQVPLAGAGFPPTAATARTQLAKLKVEWGKNWHTYKRENFGRYWSDETDAVGGRNGCDTRVISMPRAVIWAVPAAYPGWSGLYALRGT